jgi:hypothetical protein
MALVVEQQIIQEPQLADLATQDIYFPVKKVLTSSITRGMVTASDNRYSVVGTIDGQRHLLNTCSKDYNLKKNEEIFPLIEKMLDAAGIKYEAKFSHIGYAKFYGQYRFTDHIQALGTEKDELYPMLKVGSSYNGKLPLNLSLGIHRLVCENGLTIPVLSRHNYHQSVKHVEKLDEVFERWLAHIDKFIHEFAKKEDNPILTPYMTLHDVPCLRVKERIEEVRNAVKEFPVKVMDLALKFIAEETDMLGYQQANQWLVYNGMNKALYTNNTVKHPEFKDIVDSKIFDYIYNTSITT